MTKLVQASISQWDYQYIRNHHYVPNNGCIGRQIHYVIFRDGNTFGEHSIGIISGASPVFACRPRDDYFGITKDNRIEKLDTIINNTVFRLEYQEPNLGSRILSLWRKQITKDWYKKYGIKPTGFETFVYGRNRTGAVYKADNWLNVGITAGKARNKREAGASLSSGIVVRHPTDKKLIFCRTI